MNESMNEKEGLSSQQEVKCMRAKVLQSCLTLGDPMVSQSRPPGSSIHGILQARILGWVAMPSSREPFQPRDQTCFSCGSCIAGVSLLLSHRGSPESQVLVNKCERIHG